MNVYVCVSVRERLNATGTVGQKERKTDGERELMEYVD